MNASTAFLPSLASLAVLLAACGGSVGETADPSDGGGDGSTSDTTPGPDSGIDTSPTDGGPGPDTGPKPGCPTAYPTGGTPCAPVGLVCGYGDDPRPGCRQRANCTASGWETPIGACPPPPTDTCPATAADANGKTCTKEGAYCTYGDTVCGCGACFGGPCGTTARWTCAEPPTNPDCPRALPNLGVACTKEGATCVYGNCSSGNIAERDCKGGYWVDAPIACPASSP